jgi:hypothetical protein
MAGWTKCNAVKERFDRKSLGVLGDTRYARSTTEQDKKLIGVLTTIRSTFKFDPLELDRRPAISVIAYSAYIGAQANAVLDNEGQYPLETLAQLVGREKRWQQCQERLRNSAIRRMAESLAARERIVLAWRNNTR